MEMMIPWLHFTPGDFLLFQSWRPTSVGSVIAACLGLVLLGVFDRWVAASRSLLEQSWRHRLAAIHSNGANEKSDVKGLVPRAIPPFVLAHDLPRGLIHAAQALLGYLLMLSVMTFNVTFFLSATIGLGVGEMIFGRLSTHGGRKSH